MWILEKGWGALHLFYPFPINVLTNYQKPQIFNFIWLLLWYSYRSKVLIFFFSKFYCWCCCLQNGSWLIRDFLLLLPSVCQLSRIEWLDFYNLQKLTKELNVIETHIAYFWKFKPFVWNYTMLMWILWFSNHFLTAYPDRCVSTRYPVRRVNITFVTLYQVHV